MSGLPWYEQIYCLACAAFIGWHVRRLAASYFPHWFTQERSRSDRP